MQRMAGKIWMQLPDMEGKTISEVKEYAKVFWERCHEIADWKRIEGNIKEAKQDSTKEEDMLKAKKNLALQEPVA